MPGARKVVGTVGLVVEEHVRLETAAVPPDDDRDAGDGLSVRRAIKRFGPVPALDGCSFAVGRGRMLGFLGPNGAGKTTAMRAVFGLVGLDNLSHSDPDRYAETLARLREFPATTWHCGHFASFGRQRALELIDAYLERPRRR